MARLAVLTSRKRTVALALAATTLAAAGVLAVVHFTGTSERVAPPEQAQEYQPPRIAADEPAASAPTSTDYSSVVDITGELLGDFSGDLSFARTLEQGEDVYPYGEPDTCLLEWATANLEALASAGTYETMTICDRPTLVLAGPDGADTKVLVHGAREDTAPEGARQLIADSTHDRMAFVAVRSADGMAQLLATAELPG